jgi:hypothetical protein
MHKIVALHYPQSNPKLVEAAIAVFYELRERGFEKPPATSELLNWIGALERTGQAPESQPAPLIGVLLKRSGDILRFREGGGPRKRRYQP